MHRQGARSHGIAPSIAARRTNLALAVMGSLAILLALLLKAPQPADDELGIDLGELEAAKVHSPDDPPQGNSMAVAHDVRVAVQNSLHIRTVCSTDSKPLGEVTLRWQANDAKAWFTGLSDANGLLEVPREVSAPPLSGPIRAKALAPGFETWEGELPSFAPSDSPFVIDMQPLGSILVRVTAEGAAIRGRGPRASALAQTAPEVSRVTGQRRGDLDVEILGLRPGRLHDVRVFASDFRSETVGDVVAGWPEPTLIEVDLVPQGALAITLTGNLTPELCSLLRVSILGEKGQRGGASRASWDSGRAVGVAIPQYFGLDGELRIFVHGPLGVLLASKVWSLSGGEAPVVNLELSVAEVSLICELHAHETSSGDYLRWKSGGEEGMLSPEAGSIELLTSESSPTSTVDLQWAHCVAMDVQLPRQDPIVFSQGVEGELRIIDVPADAALHLSLAHRTDGTAWPLVGGEGSTELFATPPAGAYDLNLRGDVLGAPVIIRAGEVTVVSLTEMQEWATLVVRLPSGEEDASRGSDWQVQVMREDTSRLDLIQALAFPSTALEGRIAGLAPGPIIVKVKVPGLGEADCDVFLEPNVETTLVPAPWNQKRKLTLQFWDAAGAPLAGLRTKSWLAPRGRSPALSGKTRRNGQVTAALVGGGLFIVTSEKGIWLEQLDPEQELVELHLAPDAEGELRVVCSGWWAGRVQNVFGLTRGSGPAVSLGRASRAGNEFTLDGRLSTVALVATMMDDTVAILAVDPSLPTLELIEAPLATELELVVAQGQPRPQSVVPSLLEIAGVSVKGTILAEMLGDPIPCGQTISMMHSVPLMVTADGLAGTGGVRWRAEPVLVLPGASKATLTLMELE